MNENLRVCPNCNYHDEISREDFTRLVGANREAAMLALGVRKGQVAPRKRFRLEPVVDTSDGEPRVSLRRTQS